MMALVLVLLVLTCERNLLTLLLGGWVPSPALFRRPSWNLSVIFRWGWVGALTKQIFQNRKWLFIRYTAVCISASKGAPGKSWLTKPPGK